MGVMFDPYLPVVPSVPQTSLDLSVTSVTTSEVSLSWSAVAGATSYIVESTPASSPGDWSILDGDVTTTTYTNSGLSNNTAYDYRVTAVNSNGGESPFSLTVTATTKSSTADSLTLTAALMDLHGGIRVERRCRHIYRRRHFHARHELHRDDQLGRRRYSIGRRWRLRRLIHDHE